MRQHLRDLVILLAVFGALPFQVMTDSPAYATPTNSPLRVTGGVAVGTQDNTAYVTAYGAKCDGVTDDSTAFANAYAAVSATHVGSTQGGRLIVPAGQCVIASPLNFQGAHNVVIEGFGGLGQGFGGGGTTTPASTIIYTGTGSTSFLQLNSSFGVVIKRVAILYSSSSFTGVLVDFGHATGVGADATYNIIDECLLGASQAGAWNAKALVSWNNGDFNTVMHSHLQGAMAGIRFRETTNDYAVSNRVVNNLFRDFQTGATMNASNNEVIRDNVFESNTHQGPPTDAPAYTTDITTEGGSVATWNVGLVFVGNAILDFTAGHTEFDTSPTSAVNAYDLVFEGNIAADIHFANLKGASISRNQFQNTITFDLAGTYQGVSIVGNVWMTAVNYVNIPASATVNGNTRNSSTSTVGDQLVMSNHSVTSDKMTFTSGTADGATAKALTVDTTASWANTSSRLLSLSTGGSEKVYVTGPGAFFVPRYVDTSVAGPMSIGTLNPTSVTIGQSGVTTTIAGTLATGTGHALVSSTAPTISSGFGTSPSISNNNGTASFTVNVGTGGTATNGVIGLPTATTGWNCYCEDRTTFSTTVFKCRQTASSTTSATIGNFNTSAAAAAWAASDTVAVACFAY